MAVRVGYAIKWKVIDLGYMITSQTILAQYLITNIVIMLGVNDTT